MTSDGEHESEQAGSQPELPVAGSRREPDPAAPGSPEPEAVDHPSVDQPAARSSPWPARLTAIASPSYEWVMRPRVRLSLTGGLLLLIGVLLMSNSVWTLPLVVVGALMIAIAWIGHRLEGRFTIEWGQGGTELAFRATIKPAQPAHEGLTTLAGAASAPHEPVSAPEPVREQIIDGEAHT
ncbi:MAG: hypothetical protein ACLP50_19195, partial [Solirubrobacteraceae bacterium]